MWGNLRCRRWLDTAKVYVVLSGCGKNGGESGRRRSDVTLADNLRNNFAAKISEFARLAITWLGRTDGGAETAGGRGRSGKSAAAGGSENGHKSSPSLSTDAATVRRDGAQCATTNGTSWFKSWSGLRRVWIILYGGCLMLLP